MRRLLSIVLAVAALLSAAVGVITFSSSEGIEETIRHSRQIDGALRDAAEFVAEWRRDRGRLPSPREFEAWASVQPPGWYSAARVAYSVGRFPDEVVDEFGPPAGESYLLTFWRGEWNEYYAAWADRGTLSFDRSEYFMLGSEWRDLVAFGAASMELGWLAIATWRSRLR